MKKSNLNLTAYLLPFLILLSSCAIDSNSELQNETITKISDTNQSKEKNKQKNLICRREKVLGSNLRQKVCYDRSEITARTEMDKEDLRSMQRSLPPPGQTD
jgi:hypothetical protein